MGDFPEAISILTAGESECRRAISAGSVFILFRVTYAALCSRKHISLTFPVQGSFWISGHDRNFMRSGWCRHLESRQRGLDMFPKYPGLNLQRAVNRKNTHPAFCYWKPRKGRAVRFSTQDFSNGSWWIITESFMSSELALMARSVLGVSAVCSVSAVGECAPFKSL